MHLQHCFSLDHVPVVQVGAKLSCGASLGESLKLLRFDQGAVEVKDERADHTAAPPTSTSPLAAICTLCLARL